MGEIKKKYKKIKKFFFKKNNQIEKHNTINLN
jgi:hypothetical protein